ncbi:MAG: LuxR C-terminal-related transcriptional regulator [Alphaproteobacteria bacterium]|nr:LuxR C-terminal-related transcriptional regulator [Alphaproteobacteria bacterium]MBU1513200.1 LuxR C-terminal-related transcriptional regulator [Alphaproteobacteria bacterium]MBU2095308.1 LuxR C-terminal-related transcriptional regulator [Alphaproteobacteria bacterium]MBU2306730.1 LuxR C-terminal-related transcriptional regulator [Alphaproteobacteria bacterium]
MATLRHLAALRLPPALVFEAVTRSLKDIAPFETATLVTYGPNLEPTDSFLTHEISPDVTRQYFTRWYNREERLYVPDHAQAASGRAPDVFAVSAYAPQIAETELYDEVWRHLGFRHMAALTLRQGGQAAAHMGLGRPTGPDFTATDLDRLAAAADFAAMAVSGGPAGEGWLETDALVEIETALIVADAHGEPQQLSSIAWRLLQWACLAHQDETVVRACLAGNGHNDVYGWARPILAELARRVSAGFKGQPAPPALLRRRSRHGEFVLRAFALHQGLPGGDVDHIAVEIQRHAPLEVRLFASDLFRSFTTQEQLVARLLVRGESQGEIARILGVSPHTVVSHVRNAYRRTGASNRETLIAALLPRP